MELPEEIRTALLQNAAVLMPITVGWSSHVVSSLTVEEAATYMQRDTDFADYTLNTRRRYRLSWQDGKFFSHYEEQRPESKQNSRGARRSATDCSVDGKMFYITSVHESEAPWRVLRNSLAAMASRGAEGRHGNGSYFEDVGFIMPSRVMDVQMKAPVRSNIFQVLDEAGELVQVDEVELEGTRVIRLRIISDNQIRRRAENVDLEKARIELNHCAESEETKAAAIESIKFKRQLPEKCENLFYLDPQFNYAMRRYEWKHEQMEGPRTIDCRKFQPVPGRPLYLPTNCTDGGGKWTHVHEVTEISVDRLPDEQFSFKQICSTPGAVIHETLDGEERKNYVVETDGTLRELYRGEWR